MARIQGSHGDLDVAEAMATIPVDLALLVLSHQVTLLLATAMAVGPLTVIPPLVRAMETLTHMITLPLG